MKKLIHFILFFLLYNITFSQWQEVILTSELPGPPSDIKVYNNIGIMSIYSETIRKSTDGGLSWFSFGIPILYTDAISYVNGNIWIMKTNTVPLKSTDMGNTFVTMGNGMVNNERDICTVEGNSSKIFTATRFNPILHNTYYSTNNGDNWIIIDTMSNLALKTLDIVVQDSLVYLGTQDFIFRSKNNGVNWQRLNTPDTNFTSIVNLCLAGNYLYMNLGIPGIFRSSDQGDTWKSVNYALKDTSIDLPSKLDSYNNHLFVSNSFSSSLKYCSLTDTVWKRVNLSGTTGYPVGNFYIAGEYYYVYTSSETSRKLFRRKISEVVSISQNSTEVPLNFTLHQNYPNPFNPSTTINYELKITNYVTLKVFDLNGKEIQTLVNKKQTAGSYSIEFNTSNLSSGIYFYRIEVSNSKENFSQTKKMVLVK